MGIIKITERELFEFHFKPITGWDFYWSDNINQYMDHQTNAAWFGWQASANREGYKLVPIDPTEEIKDAMCGYECNTDVEIVGCYEAIMGAVE